MSRSAKPAELIRFGLLLAVLGDFCRLLAGVLGGLLAVGRLLAQAGVIAWGVMIGFATRAATSRTKGMMSG